MGTIQQELERTKTREQIIADRAAMAKYKQDVKHRKYYVAGGLGQEKIQLSVAIGTNEDSSEIGALRAPGSSKQGYFWKIVSLN
jgi:hypothetical protein